MIVRPGADGGRVGGAASGGALGGVSKILGTLSTVFAAVGFFSNLFGGGTQVGPRLKDTNIQLDGEGLELAKTWGCGLHDGRLVWTSGLEEKKHTSGGGLFGAILGSGKTITYTYGAKAVWLGGMGPMSRVRAIRLASTAIYDWNGGGDQQKGAELTWNGQFWSGQTKLTKKGEPILIRVYPGTLTQPVDAAIVAQKGAGVWTNYPGQWLVALEIPDLSDFGNSLPRVTIEVEYTQTALSFVILEIASWVGLTSTDFNLTALTGLTCAKTDGEGFTVDQRKKASDVLQEMGQVYDFDLVEENGVITAKRHPTAYAATLQENELRVLAGYDRGQGVAEAPQKEVDEQSLPFVQEFLFRDVKRDGATGYRTAKRFDATTRKKGTSSSSATLAGARGGEVARRVLANTWAAAKGRSGTLGLEYLRLAPGDEVLVPTPDGLLATLIDNIKCPLYGPIDTSFLGFDALVSGLPLPPDTEGLERPTPIEPGVPIIFAAPLSIVSGEGFWTSKRAVVFGVCRSIGDTKWEGADVRIQERPESSSSDDDYVQRSTQEVNGEAIIGELVGSFSPSSSTAFSGRVYGGQLFNAGADTGEGIPNLLVLQNGLLVRFTTAVEVSDADPNSKLYNISGVLSDLYGSDDFDDGSALGAGTRFMLLCDQNGNWSDDPEWIPLPVQKYVDGNPTGAVERRIHVSEDSGGDVNVYWDLGTTNGENLRPPSPLVTGATLDSTDGLTIEGTVRSRYYDDYDGQPIDNLDIVSGDGHFLLVLTNGGTSETVGVTEHVSASTGAFELNVSAADITSLFGSVPAHFTGTIALYGTKGSPVQLGRTRAFETHASALLLENGGLLLLEDGSHLSLE